MSRTDQVNLHLLATRMTIAPTTGLNTCELHLMTTRPKESKRMRRKTNNNLSNGCFHLSVGTAQREEASKSSSGTKDGSWSDARPGHLSGDRVHHSRDVAVARVAVA